MPLPSLAIAGVAAIWLIIINTLAWTQFGEDKRRAGSGLPNTLVRRIPERHLLRLAFWGGSPAALLAQKHFRHKTRKQPFANQLRRIIGFQIVLLLSATIWFLLPSNLRIEALQSLYSLLQSAFDLARKLYNSFQNMNQIS